MTIHLEKGAHTYINCGIYCHHGIYVGNNKAIHYLSKGVSLTDMETFSRGHSIKIKQHIFKKDKDEIVSRTYSRLGDNAIMFLPGVINLDEISPNKRF